MKSSAKGSNLKVLQFIGILCLFIVWVCLSYAVQSKNPQRGSVILPSPLQVINDFPGIAKFSLQASGDSIIGSISVIAHNSMVSLARLLGGTILGIFFGVILGLAVGCSEKLRLTISPILMIVRTIPILALIPLFLVWFGGKEQGNIIYIIFATFSMIVINTIEAVRNVPPVYQKFASTLGANKWQIFKSVVFPHIIPELVGGIRVVIGVSWAILLAAEYLASETGLGYMLIVSERYLYTSRMICIVMFIMVFAALFNYSFLKLANYITRWAPHQNT